MAESRLVACNLMANFRVRDLLPDQKLIVYHIWVTSPSDAGCFEPDIPGWSGHLSITPSSLIEALNDFEVKKIITQDKETGEIFINDWFRVHKFDTTMRRNMLNRAIEKIQSQKLNKLVLEKMSLIYGKNNDNTEESMTYAPKESKLKETKSSACKHAEDLPSCVQAKENSNEGPSHRRKPEIINGVKCWVEDDSLQTKKMVSLYGCEMLEMAVGNIIKKGFDPLPSKVEKELERLMKEKALKENNDKKFHIATNTPKPLKPFMPPAPLMETVRNKKRIEATLVPSLKSQETY